MMIVVIPSVSDKRRPAQSLVPRLAMAEVLWQPPRSEVRAMESTRRLFLGSVVGVPTMAYAGWQGRPGQITPAPVVPPVLRAAPDRIVLKHAFNEIADVYADIRRTREPRGEHLRRVASASRLLQASLNSTGHTQLFDQRLRAPSFATKVNDTSVFDEDAFRKAVRARTGLEITEPLFDQSAKDRAGRVSLIGQHPGFDRQLLDQAAGLEQLAIKIDRHGPMILAQTEVWLCINASGGGNCTPVGVHFDPCTGWWMLIIEMELATILFSGMAMAGAGAAAAAAAAAAGDLAWVFGINVVFMKIMAFFIAGCTI